MEAFKRQVLGLQAVIDKLGERVDTIEGREATKACHFVSADEEFGIVKLDDLDTFRFNIEKQSFSDNGAYHQNQTIYSLVNPSDEMKECVDILKLQDPNIIYFNRIYSLKDISETQNLSDAKYYNPYGPGGASVRLMPSKLQKLFDKKFMETSDEFGTFKRKITIEYDHTYEIPPHISFYILPVNKKISSANIVDVTNKKCIIEIEFGRSIRISPNTAIDDYNMTEDYTLHFHVRGVLKL